MNDNLMELIVMVDVLCCVLVGCIIVVIFYFVYVC